MHRASLCLFLVELEQVVIQHVIHQLLTIFILTLHPQKTCFHVTKVHVIKDERHIITVVKVARFLCVVGGTEQQCHSFMDYTHVGVFQAS